MSPAIVVYGIDPRQAPPGEPMGRATWDAVRRLGEFATSVAFVDVRTDGVQEKLRRCLGRDVGPRDVPIVEVARPPAGDDTGSWESFFSTPGATLEYMKRVNTAVDTLSASIGADPAAFARAPADFRVGWTRFVQDWKEFYAKNQGFFSRTFADVWDDTKVYEQHVREWRENWQKVGGKPSAPGLPDAHHMPDVPTPEGVGNMALGIGALLAVVAGVVVASRH